MQKNITQECHFISYFLKYMIFLNIVLYFCYKQDAVTFDRFEKKKESHSLVGLIVAMYSIVTIFGLIFSYFCTHIVNSFAPIFQTKRKVLGHYVKRTSRLRRIVSFWKVWRTREKEGESILTCHNQSKLDPRRSFYGVRYNVAMHGVGIRPERPVIFNANQDERSVRFGRERHKESRRREILWPHRENAFRFLSRSDNYPARKDTTQVRRRTTTTCSIYSNVFFSFCRGGAV